MELMDTQKPENIQKSRENYLVPLTSSDLKNSDENEN